MEPKCSSTYQLSSDVCINAVTCIVFYSFKVVWRHAPHWLQWWNAPSNSSLYLGHRGGVAYDVTVGARPISEWLYIYTLVAMVTGQQLTGVEIPLEARKSPWRGEIPLEVSPIMWVNSPVGKSSLESSFEHKQHAHLNINNTRTVSSGHSCSTLAKVTNCHFSNSSPYVQFVNYTFTNRNKMFMWFPPFQWCMYQLCNMYSSLLIQGCLKACSPHCVRN